jgi:hypothetical protein
MGLRGIWGGCWIVDLCFERRGGEMLLGRIGCHGWFLFLKSDFVVIGS